MEETPLQDVSMRDHYGGQKRSSAGKRIIILVLFLLVVGGIFAGVRFLGTGEQKQEETADITPTPTEFEFPTDTPTPVASPTVAVTPTPTPKATPTVKPSTAPVDKATGLDRSAVSIEVKNGSGAAGAASKAADILKALGYKVVSTGNADNYNYEETVIQVTSGKSNYLPLLKKDLSSDYTIGSTSATLSSTTADAVVIVGKQ